MHRYTAGQDEEEGSTMDADTQRVLEHLTEVEEAAEDVLTTKQQVTVEAKTKPPGGIS